MPFSHQYSRIKYLPHQKAVVNNCHGISEMLTRAAFHMEQVLGKHPLDSFFLYMPENTNGGETKTKVERR